MGYYQVPIDVLENRDLLRDWAAKALSVAERKADK
jgi:TfoX/Sxy family transcriptional regulator of competence genes